MEKKNEKNNEADIITQTKGREGKSNYAVQEGKANKNRRQQKMEAQRRKMQYMNNKKNTEWKKQQHLTKANIYRLRTIHTSLYFEIPIISDEPLSLHLK